MSAVTAAPLARRTAGGRLAAALVGLGLLVLAVLLVLGETPFRRAEAEIASRIMSPLVDGTANAAGNVIWFGIGTGTVTGFSITVMCSTLILMAPLLALAGLMLLARPLAIGRVLTASAAALLLVAVCNLIRYCAAAIALQQWGHEGFDLVHRYLGSLFVIAGFIVAFVLLLRLATSSRARRTRHRGGRA